MFVLVFADSSNNIGQGHIFRTLSLAHELRNRGATVEYFCRPLEGNLIKEIQEKGINVHKPKCTDRVESTSDNMNKYLEWDAVEPVLKEIATKNNIDWALVDGYAMGEKFETSLRDFSTRILALDDQPNRRHDCDILLDQNYSTDDTRYDTLLPNGAIKLLGQKYALIRPEFLVKRKSVSPRNGDVKRIVLFFGGADATRESIKSLEAVTLLNRPDIEFDLVIGSSNQSWVAIEKLAMEIPNLTCVFDIKDMECMLAHADLAIGAGGSSTWERCLLGLPAMLVITAENQRLLTEEVVVAGAVESLGWHEELDAEMMAKRIKLLLNNPQRIAEMSRKAMELVDGLGASRVADAIGA